MSKNYQPPSQKSIDALAASIVLFLVELARAIFSFDPGHTRRRLHRAIQRAERGVEMMVFLMALRLAVPPPQRDLFVARRNTPGGFRRRCAKGSTLLYKYARIRLRRGNFYLRIARLIEVVAQPARYVQRFLTRLHKGIRGSQMLAAHPPAHTLSADAPLMADYADSSRFTGCAPTHPARRDEAPSPRAPALASKKFHTLPGRMPRESGARAGT